MKSLKVTFFGKRASAQALYLPHLSTESHMTLFYKEMIVAIPWTLVSKAFFEPIDAPVPLEIQIPLTSRVQ